MNLPNALTVGRIVVTPLIAILPFASSWGLRLTAYLLSATFPFITPLGPIGLSWWVIAIVIGRELFMTVFRQAAARRGVVIAAIGPAKWKSGFHWLWVGSAYFWFFAATIATNHR